MDVGSSAETIRPGLRVLVGGGYDPRPTWLNGGNGYSGTVDRLIPGQSDQRAVVVRLDAPITVGGRTGTILVLELRYAGAVWRDGETVHVELCDFEPDDKSWRDRTRGEWVESHATVTIVP